MQPRMTIDEWIVRGLQLKVEPSQVAEDLGLRLERVFQVGRAAGLLALPLDERIVRALQEFPLLSVSAVAVKLGVCPYTVRRAMRRHNMPERSRLSPRAKQIVEALAAGAGTMDTARRFKCHSSFVSKLRHRTSG